MTKNLFSVVDMMTTQTGVFFFLLCSHAVNEGNKKNGTPKLIETLRP